MKKIFLLSAIMATLFQTSISSGAMKGPWSINSESPVISGPVAYKKDVDPSVNFNPFVVTIKVFQKYISPVDGDRCYMYPTCSAYGVDAFRKHGSVMGFILTADRLMHETDEPSYAPVIVKHGHYRYYDPVGNNDFWWDK